jgi:hypothetical protein
MIMAELWKYVDKIYGKATWEKLLEEAGLGPRIFAHTRTYPDEEALALISAASRLTVKPIPAILEEFGEFIVPDLVALYGGLIKPEWKTLDLIEHTEETIHTVVRRQNPGATPPALECSRLSPDRLVIRYRSSRKMCGLAKGIAKGVAKHYKERIILTESRCMLVGNGHCEISVALMN